MVDGVPKDIFEKHIGESERNVTFHLSDKIKEETLSTSKIPHFRKGHFRSLQSDYFANKKGQIIFVTETMVKGKAKTISMSDNIDKFANGIKKDI